MKPANHLVMVGGATCSDEFQAIQALHFRHTNLTIFRAIPGKLVAATKLMVPITTRYTLHTLTARTLTAGPL